MHITVELDFEPNPLLPNPLPLLGQIIRHRLLLFDLDVDSTLRFNEEHNGTTYSGTIIVTP